MILANEISGLVGKRHQIPMVYRLRNENNGLHSSNQPAITQYVGLVLIYSNWELFFVYTIVILFILFKYIKRKNKIRTSLWFGCWSICNSNSIPFFIFFSFFFFFSSIANDQLLSYLFYFWKMKCSFIIKCWTDHFTTSKI